jgi:hypothetical protein
LKCITASFNDVILDKPEAEMGNTRRTFVEERKRDSHEGQSTSRKMRTQKARKARSFK